MCELPRDSAASSSSRLPIKRACMLAPGNVAARGTAWPWAHARCRDWPGALNHRCKRMASCLTQCGAASPYAQQRASFQRDVAVWLPLQRHRPAKEEPRLSRTCLRLVLLSLPPALCPLSRCAHRGCRRSLRGHAPGRPCRWGLGCIGRPCLRKSAQRCLVLRRCAFQQPHALFVRATEPKLLNFFPAQGARRGLRARAATQTGRAHS